MHVDKYRIRPVVQDRQVSIVPLHVAQLLEHEQMFVMLFFTEPVGHELTHCKLEEFIL